MSRGTVKWYVVKKVDRQRNGQTGVRNGARPVGSGKNEDKRVADENADGDQSVGSVVAVGVWER